MAVTALRIFVAWDFETEGLGDFLSIGVDEAARRATPIDLRVAGINVADQGGIWERTVREEIERADRVAVFVDRPNVNVGYELGYAMSAARRSWTGRRRLRLCRWAPGGATPHAAVAWTRFPFVEDLAELSVAFVSPWLDALATEAGWDCDAALGAPATTASTLLLVPRTGRHYGEVVAPLSDFKGIDAVGLPRSEVVRVVRHADSAVWVLADHPGRKDERDGVANTQLAVLAGYARGAGLRERICVPTALTVGRSAADLSDRWLRFANIGELKRHVEAFVHEVSEARRPSPPVIIAPPSDAARAALPYPVPASLSATAPSAPPVPGLEEARASFVGREDLVRTMQSVLDAVAPRAPGERPHTAGVWFHGLGGMGKSWLLRKALLLAEDHRGAAGGGRPPDSLYVDCEDPEACGRALSDPTMDVVDVLDPLAARLASLRGPAAVASYVRARERYRDAIVLHRHSMGRLRDQLSSLGRLTAPDIDPSLRIVLDARGAPSDAASLAQYATDLLEDAAGLRALMDAWLQQREPLSDVDRRWRAEPDESLARAFAATLSSAARERPLLVALDTAEFLGVPVEAALRAVVGGLASAGDPVGWFVSSRLAPGRSDVAATAAWADLTGKPVLAVAIDDKHLLTPGEIGALLAKTRFPDAVGAEVAAAVHRATLGVPLAVRMVLDLQRDGHPILAELAALPSPGDRSPSPNAAQAAALLDRVLADVCDRFLKHMRGKPAHRVDLERVYALALLPSLDRPVLDVMWGGSPATASALWDLGRRFALLNDGDLHGSIRRLLRDRWLRHGLDATALGVADRVRGAVSSIAKLGEVGSEAHQQQRLRELNALAWTDAAAATSAAAEALALAVVYGVCERQTADLVAEVFQGHHSVREDSDVQAVLHFSQRRSKGADEPRWASGAWRTDARDLAMAWVDATGRLAARKPSDDAVSTALDLVRAVLRGRRMAAGATAPADERVAVVEDLLAVSARLPRTAGGAPRTLPARVLREELFDHAYALADRRHAPRVACRAYYEALRLGHQSPLHIENNLGNLLQAHAADLVGLEAEWTDARAVRRAAYLRYKEAIRKGEPLGLGLNNFGCLLWDFPHDLLSIETGLPTEPDVVRRAGAVLLRDVERDSTSWYPRSNFAELVACRAGDLVPTTYPTVEAALDEARRLVDEVLVRERPAGLLETLGLLLRRHPTHFDRSTPDGARALDGSESAYVEAIGVDSGRVDGHNGLGRLYLDHAAHFGRPGGRFPTPNAAVREAVACFARATEADPESPFGWDSLAAAYERHPGAFLRPDGSFADRAAVEAAATAARKRAAEIRDARCLPPADPRRW